MTKLFNYIILALSFSVSNLFKERLRKAKELATVMDFEAQMIAGFELMAPMIEQQAQQLNLNKAEAQELYDIYKDWFHLDLDIKKC